MDQGNLSALCMSLLCVGCGSSAPASVSTKLTRDAGSKGAAGSTAQAGAGHAGSTAADGGGVRKNITIENPDLRSDAGPDAGNNPEGSAGSNAGSGAGGSAASSDAGVSGFMISGTMSDALSADPLPGVAICLLASPAKCSMTDDQGAFSIAGLGAKGAGITGALAGYVTGIWPVTPTGSISNWSILLRSETRISKLAQGLGASFGPSAGAIVFAAKDSSGNLLAGVSVATSAGKLGYFDAAGTTLDTALTATSADGGGFVFEIPPGDIAVTFTLPGRTCVRNGAEGWPGSGTATMTVPVQGGKLTRAAAVCE